MERTCQLAFFKLVELLCVSGNAVQFERIKVKKSLKVDKMLHEFSRTELLIGKESLDKLKLSRVAVFGIGGVGSYAAEGLARAGVGKFVPAIN